MQPPRQRFIFLFLDGVGLAPASDQNPLSRYTPEGANRTVEPMPYLAEHLGGGLLAGREIAAPNLLLKPLDATMDVPGRPQSATGQTALYTGRNAAEFLGRHLTGFANGSLRILIEESGLFKLGLAAGRTVTSANLYSDGYFEAIAQRKIRYSVGALLNMTANVPFRMPEDYRRGEAIFWDITGRHLPERGLEVEVISPQEAGRRLANIAASHDITLFECYLPDFAGHLNDIAQTRGVLADVDEFIGGILENLPPDTSLIISSDHGNTEDATTKLHTLNPVPLLVFGDAAPRFATAKSIMDITPLILAE
jgi:2,3-bisphosphoglycerate-independent phosphoglycerate mutase